MPSRTFQLLPGKPWPLGATLCDGGINFAVYSENAVHVLLAIFEGANDEIELNAALPVRTGFIWHGFLPDAKQLVLDVGREPPPFARLFEREGQVVAGERAVGTVLERVDEIPGVERR